MEGEAGGVEGEGSHRGAQAAAAPPGVQGQGRGLGEAGGAEGAAEQAGVVGGQVAAQTARPLAPAPTSGAGVGVLATPVVHGHVPLQSG